MSNSNLRLGVVLGYAPEQSIVDQGIGRLLGFLIEGLSTRATGAAAIAIACPAWYVPQVQELLADLRIGDGKVTIIATDGIPYILRLRNLYRRLVHWRLRRRRFASRWRIAVKRVGFRTALSMLGTTSTSFFVAQGLMLIVFGIVLLPFALAIYLPRGAASLLRKTGVGIGAKSPRVRTLMGYATSPLRALRRDAFAHRVYEAVRSQELDRLVRKINRLQAADVWYCPTIFWPEFSSIAGPKVFAIPDMVYVDFPLGYSIRACELIFEKAQEIIRTDAHLVCYSEYVRTAHLVDGLGVAPQRISVIRHGLVEMQHYVPGGVPAGRRDWAIRTINACLRSRYGNYPYLAEFDFSDVRFAIYTSQARRHKNLLQLVRIWDSLLRKHFCGAKLILTCRLTDDPEVERYVQARRLQYDVLEFSGVPSEILAALNVLAVVSVNPSLFEGGFPFTFSEAYSVGTPSVMSRIPAVLEVVRDPGLRASMLFDPYDPNNMAERIRWALDNRDLLLRLQRPLYDELARRSWQVAALEYVELFSRLEAID